MTYFLMVYMKINPQFVDKCAAQIHFMYKKEGKLVIEKWEIFAVKINCQNLTVLILSGFFSLIYQFL